MIRTLVCGYGAWGRVLTQHLLAHSDFFVSGIYDPDADAASVARAKNLETYRTLEDALSGARPRLVVVATPIREAAFVITTSLVRYMHVLAAKPAALTLRDAEAMSRLAEVRGVSLTVDYTLLGAEKYRSIKHQLGDLGAIKAISTTRTTRTDRSSQPVLDDLLVHDLALLADLDATLVWRVTRAYAAADHATIDLRASSGAYARLEARRTDTEAKRELRVECERGAIKWDQTRDALFVERDTGVILYSAPRADDLVDARLDRVVETINGAPDNRSLLVDVTRLLEEARKEALRDAA